MRNIFSVYCLIRSKGFNAVKKEFSKTSFYRLVADLCECGFSKADLQNLNENRDVKTVDLDVLLNIDFENQYPAWYVEPTSQFNFKQVA